MTDITVTAAERRLILSALLVVLLLSALDQTIVSTAMPRIIEQLQGLSMYAWVTTSYLLASTVAVPIYGKLSDQYGRKPILVTGVLVFLLGSVLCGLSGEFGELPVLGGGMMQLVVFRALQGLGGGALMTSVFATIADLYAPRERGKLFGIFGAVFGLATVVGPFIGGFFTDHGTVTLLDYEVAGWRWVFYVNLPLGLVALFMILYRMPTLRRGSGGRVDYVGAALVVMTFTPLLLALSLGGTQYAWGSQRIVGLFALSAVMLIIFLWVERRTHNAILPLQLFRIKAFRIAVLALFVVSMSFLGVVMFMPLYMQVVQGLNAIESGLALLPLMGGLIVSGTLCGRLVTRTGRYKPFMVAGGILLTLGVLALSAIGPDTTNRDLAWRLALTGVGLGPAQTLFSLVIQNTVPVTELGVATSMSQFGRQIGSTVGVAIFGTLLTHGLTAELPKRLPLLPGAASHQIDLGHVQSEAMDVARIRAGVEEAMNARYQVIERAYHGDQTAVADILADPRLPERIKAPLRDGGIRARIHGELTQRAEVIVAALHDGQAGRDRLLREGGMPEPIAKQLANIPVRALRDSTLAAGVGALFRNSVLAQENARVEAATRQALQQARSVVDSLAVQLSDETQRGMKLAFSKAITQMFGRALWLVALGAFIIFFIPELPLRARDSAA